MDENNQKERSWSGNREEDRSNQAPDLEIPQIEWSKSETRASRNSAGRTGQSSRYRTDIRLDNEQQIRRTASERRTTGSQEVRSASGETKNLTRTASGKSGNGTERGKRPTEKIRENTSGKKASQEMKKQSKVTKTKAPEKRNAGSGKQKTSAAGRKKSSSGLLDRIGSLNRTLIPAAVAMVIIAALLIAIVIHAIQTGNKEEKETNDQQAEITTLNEEESNGTEEEESGESVSEEAESDEMNSEGDESGEQQESEEEQQPQGNPDEELEQGAEPSAETGETVYAITVLNVRSIPDASGEQLGQLQAGEAVTRTADENGWSTITYNGVTAYVSSQYVTTEPPSQGEETPAGTGTTSLSMYPIHEGQWDLNTLDNDQVNFGNDPKQRAENMVPTDWAYYERLWGQFNVDWIQDFNSNVVYLTMDEGFGNDETITILDTLKEKNVKIVFFLTKNFVDDRPELVQRMIDEGHILGNHTCSHPNMVSLSIEEATSEIMTLHNQVKEQFGYEMSLFRFPEGAYSNQRLALVENLGYKSVFWSFAYNDYSAQPLPLEEARAEIWSYIHPGAIFLLHANSEVNMTLLGDFIDEVRSRGYEFGTYPLAAN